MIEIKKQPRSEESEIVVIGSCILSPNGEVYDRVSQILTTSDFFSIHNQILFDTIGQLVANGTEVDEITILERLRKDGNEEQVGGIAAIYSIQNRVTMPGPSTVSTVTGSTS